MPHLCPLRVPCNTDVSLCFHANLARAEKYRYGPCGALMTRRLSGAQTPVRRGRGRGAAPKAAGSNAAAPQTAPAATCPRTHIVWARFTDLLPVAWTRAHNGCCA